MRQHIILPRLNNRLEEEINNLFHSSGLPMHFNKTGNKEFTNYQRVSIIILFQRSKKSLRDFVVEFSESKWISWLGLEKVPKKSTLHDWLKLFDMQKVRSLNSKLLPEKVELTSGELQDGLIIISDVVHSYTEFIAKHLNQEELIEFNRKLYG